MFKLIFEPRPHRLKAPANLLGLFLRLSDVAKMNYLDAVGAGNVAGLDEG